MSTADLYIRVSTDEQADKGYSQRNQEETLRRYCLNQGIEVREVIHEYHSAKTFKRPAWQGYISRVKNTGIVTRGWYCLPNGTALAGMQEMLIR
ncbi:recombinase family protein [Pedobacter sp.]|uniref:recombinase family protein n=1 Tax=Pedobacter sp. TaxID=1411316 RepID=UPI003BA9B407